MHTFRKTNYSGYTLVNRDYVLAELAAIGIFPMHSRVIFEHVTYQYPDKNIAPEITTAEIIAHYFNNYVQCVVVRINGSIHRPDGQIFHITVSVADGHKPVESNDLIKAGTNRVDIVPPIKAVMTAF